MIAAEIDRFAAGDPLVNVADRAAIFHERAPARDRCGHRLGAGPCFSTPTATRSPSASASTRTPRSPASPARRSSTRRRNWQLACACIAEAIERAAVDASAIRAVATTSMREGMVLYDGGGHEIWACPNVDSRAGAEAAESSSRAPRRRSTPSLEQYAERSRSLRDAKGEFRYLEGVITVETDRRGNQIGVRGVVRDITDQKTAEQALKESEERYRQLVELSPQAIVLHTEDKFTYLNPAATRALGCV